MAVGVAAGMALLAAVMFAIAAVAQNVAVADVVGRARTPALGGAEFRSLVRSRTWVGGVSLTALASVLHAGALVLAPVAVVQPIGVLSVPFAVVLAASRTRIRPPAVVWMAAAVCLGAVVGFVLLADVGLGTSPAPRFVDVVAAALGAGALSGGMALWAIRRSGWLRCAGFAASGATAFGLVSALMRLDRSAPDDGCERPRRRRCVAARDRDRPRVGRRRVGGAAGARGGRTRCRGGLPDP